jgi:hypothetical protein
MDAGPSHEWLGYCHSVASRLGVFAPLRLIPSPRPVKGSNPVRPTQTAFGGGVRPQNGVAKNAKDLPILSIPKIPLAGLHGREV